MNDIVSDQVDGSTRIDAMRPEEDHACARGHRRRGETRPLHPRGPRGKRREGSADGRRSEVARDLDDQWRGPPAAHERRGQRSD
ncbi:hypothetical protein MHY30_00810 [Microbacterium sp. ACRRU]|uniref:hypothetical protein n=1 Tax=Microbacterium TaxID=33882 RepID=UPI001EF6C48C|nr:hypothetical protein [Microbacterium sp. ACRRU]MCG7416052.1 hypothetical protein [Microbacterium sp. ACRRU]